MNIVPSASEMLERDARWSAIIEKYSNLENETVVEWEDVCGSADENEDVEDLFEEVADGFIHNLYPDEIEPIRDDEIETSTKEDVSKSLVLVANPNRKEFFKLLTKNYSPDFILECERAFAKKGKEFKRLNFSFFTT
jgi:hypothetical protein